MMTVQEYEALAAKIRSSKTPLDERVKRMNALDQRWRAEQREVQIRNGRKLRKMLRPAKRPHREPSLVTWR